MSDESTIDNPKLAIGNALAGLSRADRLILLLHYADDLSDAEIAAALGRTEADVARRRRELKRHLAAEARRTRRQQEPGTSNNTTEARRSRRTES